MTDDHDLRDDDDELGDELTIDVPGGGVAFFSGLVFGALLGAGVALLLAPNRGDVTRRQIRRRWQRLADDTREQVGEMGEDARRRLRRQRRRLRKKLGR
jgi:gas vesicle protein